jgi:DNA modification methylase
VRIEEVGGVTIIEGGAVASLRLLDDQSVNCCVTSPPYFGLRDYGHEDQIGLEKTPDEYVAKLVDLFREVRRVLRDDGTLWLNLGDSYSRNPAKGQHKPGDTGKQAYVYDVGGGRASSCATAGLPDKNLLGIPWRVAFALQADGWYLRQDIIWHKPNPMPESVRDRCTKSHEYIFLLSKSAKYYFDAKAIAQPMAESSKERLAQPSLPNQIGSDRVPGKTNGNMKAVGPRFGGNKYGDDDNEESRTKSGNEYTGGDGLANKRDVWTVATTPYKGAHFAVFPPKLIEPCILAGCPAGGVVLDPFGGSGTTGMVAQQHGRQAVLLELNPAYVDIAMGRITKGMP